MRDFVHQNITVSPISSDDKAYANAFPEKVVQNQGCGAESGVIFEFFPISLASNCSSVGDPYFPEKSPHENIIQLFQSFFTF